MNRIKNPIVLSTWKHGYNANLKAYDTLIKGGCALDAIENGMNIAELDPEVRTVGYGGYTDDKGEVTLDACIMDYEGNAGSVVFLKDIMHPISVARKIMENSNHVMLAGKGAQEFALKNGFKKENIIGLQSIKDWKDWSKSKKQADNLINEDNHDTITMICIDGMGNLGAGSSTSGLRYKLHGRVGDSPIIGSGCYLDNTIGAAGATGQGEEIMKTVGSHLIVERMKQGLDPQEACQEAIDRIKRKYDSINFQVAYIALRIDGKFGSAAIDNSFSYNLSLNNSTRNIVLKEKKNEKVNRKKN